MLLLSINNIIRGTCGVYVNKQIPVPCLQVQGGVILLELTSFGNFATCTFLSLWLSKTRRCKGCTVLVVLGHWTPSSFWVIEEKKLTHVNVFSSEALPFGNIVQRMIRLYKGCSWHMTVGLPCSFHLFLVRFWDSWKQVQSFSTCKWCEMSC